MSKWSTDVGFIDVYNIGSELVIKQKEAHVNMNNYMCRAKDIKTGEWRYGYYVAAPEEYYNNELCHAIFDPAECEHVCQGEYRDHGWYEIDQTTLCRCTGVKDSNGMWIYEGDIVLIELDIITPIKSDVGINLNGQISYEYAQIFWDEKYFTWCVRFADGEDDSLQFGYEYCGELYVVGNIFDDPKLMEERL